jgi:hypothetical protein
MKNENYKINIIVNAGESLLKSINEGKGLPDIPKDKR